MKKSFLTIAILALFVAAGCQQQNQENSDQSEAPETTDVVDVSFSVAQNYFVKNTVAQLESPKIESAEMFDSIFGMATTMGEDGKPTAIDFTTQYVIAVLKPETDLSTSLEPTSLQKNEAGELVLHYTFTTGDTQSYTSRPHFAIIVDKKEDGPIILNEME